MYNKRTFLLLFLLLMAIVTVSSVCASDVSDVAGNESGINKIDAIENTVIGESMGGDDFNELSIDSVDAISNDDKSTDSLKADGQGKLLSELQETINKAAKGSTITLTSDYYSASGMESRGVLIDKAITINGNGHTISGSAANGGKWSRAFYITADNVVLNNIVFANGYNSYGGAIDIEDCLTVINNCDFINNTGPYGGGAIRTAGELRINNCRFINNVAQGYQYNPSTSNSDPAGFGGAIFAFYPSEGNRSLIISNSYFEYNRASVSGGALYLGTTTKDYEIRPLDAETHIFNSTFYNNVAIYGGAVANFQCCNVWDSRFLENRAMGSGGAIHMTNGIYSNDDDVFQIYALFVHGNSLFEKNTASSGGAIRYNPDPELLKMGLQGVVRIFDDVVFKSNSAETGAALHIANSFSKVENAKFISNTANDGSVIYGGNIIDSTYSGNSGKLIDEGNLIDSGYTKFTFVQSGQYYNDKFVTVTLTNTKYNTPLIYVPVNVRFSNGKSVTLKTDSDGKATYKIPFGAGTYSATATVDDDNIEVSPIQLNSIKLAKAPLTITPSKLSTTYDSGKYFQIKVVNTQTKKPVNGIKLKLMVYTGKQYKTVSLTTDSKGIAKYSASKLSIGTHKAVVSNAQTADCTGSQKTTSIVISKANYNIIAPKVTNPYKVGKFKITVKNKASGKVVGGVKLTVKLYTGKNAKTVTVKTNKKGEASVSTAGLSKGTHKIVVSTKATKFYKASSKTSSANIVAKASTKISYSDLVYYCRQDWINSNTFRTFTYGVSAKVILKDSNGNALTKTVILSHTCGNYTTGTSGKEIGLYCGRPGTLTIRFAGDSNYKASSVSIKLGDEEIHHV